MAIQVAKALEEGRVSLVQRFIDHGVPVNSILPWPWGSCSLLAIATLHGRQRGVRALCEICASVMVWPSEPELAATLFQLLTIVRQTNTANLGWPAVAPKQNDKQLQTNVFCSESDVFPEVREYVVGLLPGGSTPSEGQGELGGGAMVPAFCVCGV